MTKVLLRSMAIRHYLVKHGSKLSILFIVHTLQRDKESLRYALVTVGKETCQVFVESGVKGFQ